MGTRTPTYYTGTVTGTAGSLITALDAILVTGEGWTKTYSGTNKAVYTQAGGNGFCFRVLDDGSLAAGAREAVVRAAESATDVDTLVDPFPQVAQVADANCVWRKSNTADATARTYVAVADDRSLFLWVQFGGADNADFYPFFDAELLYPGDGYATFFGNRATGNVSSQGLAATITNTTAPGNVGYALVSARSADGLVKSEVASYVTLNGKIGFSNVAYLAYPNTATNKLHASPVYVASSYSATSGSNGTGNMLRGAVPFVFDPHIGNNTTGLAALDVATDSAYDASSSFVLLPCGTINANQPRPLLQTAGTWDVGL